jgi:signal transduction histidine kinase
MSHRILIVEDDVHIQGFAQTVLESAGYEPQVVGTAVDAKRAFQADKPDMVILDIGLPDGNGMELAQELGLGPDGDIPFLFLTGSRDLQTRLECFRLGAMDYIPKPFAVEELLARVQVHLKTKRSRDDLAQRNYELELRHRARQDLTDMIVHDLKTPLASIKGTLQLAVSHGLITEPAYQNLLVSAGTATEFMLLMLNDLLDMGRAEAACLQPEFTPVNIETLAAKLKTLFQAHCRVRGVGLESRIAPDAVIMRSDAGLLFRILVNLVSNALKFSPRGSAVVLAASAGDERQRFTVADCGPGVPDANKHRIFDKYVTAAESRGTGIGLAFCRVAAQALKGSVHVEDRPEGGSLFVVDLPAPAAERIP